MAVDVLKILTEPQPPRPCQPCRGIGCVADGPFPGVAKCPACGGTGWVEPEVEMPPNDVPPNDPGRAA